MEKTAVAQLVVLKGVQPGLVGAVKVQDLAMYPPLVQERGISKLHSNGMKVAG